MGYPEKVLADDEQVVEHLHPSWITLVPATLWFLLICALGGFALAEAHSHSDGTAQTVWVILIVVVGLVALSYLTFRPWIQWRTTHYVLTTHRVLIRRGVLRHVGRDIALQRISDVAFSQTLWDRIVKAGTLTIESAGEHGQEDLHNVPRSNQIQQLLNKLIEQDSERRQYGAAAAAARSYPAPQQPYPPQQSQPYPPQQSQPYPPQQPPGQYPQQGQYPPTQQYPPPQ